MNGYASNKEQIRRGNLDVEISPETLSAYIDNTGADVTFQTIAQNIGWAIVPFCHNSRYDDYADLAGICDLVGIQTLAEFSKIIKEMQKDHTGVQCLSELENASPEGWSASPLFIVQLILLVSRGAHVDYAELMNRVDWDGPTAKTALEVARTRGG